MKTAKSLVTILLMAITIAVSAQSKSDRVYNMFSGKEGVTSMSLSKSLLQPLEIFVDDDTKKVMYKMEKIRFMNYNENKGDLSAMNVFSRVENMLSGIKYFEINPEDIDCNDCKIDLDDDETIKLIGHGSKKKLDEFHILLKEEDNCILFSFYGNITINDLKECAEFTGSAKDL